MSFESLANELFLEVFKYLSTSHIYHAFHGLNVRLDELILEYFRNSHLDFRSISKLDFDIIIQEYLPGMLDRITSLCLSDDDDTPGQIDDFFSHGLELRQLVNLHSLLLSNIRSESIMDKIILDLPYLSNLTHLTFEQCYFPSQNTLEKTFTYGNSIWSLPQLIYLCFKVNYKYRQSHHIVDKYRRDNGICIRASVTSSTLECLSIIGVAYCSIDLTELHKHTPHLRRLSIDEFTVTQIPSYAIMPQLTTLIISFCLNYTWHRPFLEMLKNLPTLIYLKLDYDYEYPSMDGEDWKQLIRNHLPQLQRLEFRMLRCMSEYSSEEEQIDSILNSYRSDFWLVEHSWFVQFDWIPGKYYGYLYTLPYAFDKFQILAAIRSKSTSSLDLNEHSYRCVKSLMYKPRVDGLPSVSYIQFFHIEHLSIDLPVSAYFHCLVPRLDHLISIDVLSDNYDDHCQEQLQDLLDRAPRLTSIRISWKTLTSSLQQLFESQHLSVYQLELLNYGGTFDREQCIMLRNIIPAIQCRVLNLVLADRTCMLDLINTMPHLQALNVQCRIGKRHPSSKSTEKNSAWLQEQLSSTGIHAIITQQNHFIRLWIR
ncbi:unnamed protein product [Rotaria sp. Silwood1]|nr:unnamed protein product [Rotaria sp. Silwood1]CAF3900551.1 unnamed protein product [Rotaria sp. Silwood1]CAF4020513.1 unnamed protein product [Rotaria sp. Silwood1]CAF4949709.1 unnamed protein product [Rotaria sp. Silwood1]